MNEPFKLSATEAIKLIAKNKLTHLEWVSSCIERIKIKESITKAWTFLDFDQAKKLADKVGVVLPNFEKQMVKRQKNWKV